ncbi:MAG: hypothetical protein PHH73_00280, partial [Candidatus Rickettsiella isopodorum]|nr:hypothetical protein [Candidatus Rickettsiella isopodorum]
GDLSINSNASLKADTLKSIGGDLSINSKIDTKLEKRLWKNNKKHQWYLTDKCSEFILSKKGKINYKINNVAFEKELFYKVRKDKLSAQEVFAIQNMEQRRVAYKKMDKIKMKLLANYKIIDEVKDKYNNPMKVISFTIDGYNEPFLYFNCICPSTGREYFIETRQEKCESAKSQSFGYDEIEFTEEY